MKFLAALALLSLFFLGNTQEDTPKEAVVVVPGEETVPIVTDAAEGSEEDVPANGNRRERRERGRRDRRRDRDSDDDEDRSNETET